MHFRTKIYMYYQQMNDYKLPVYIINVNYQQRHLSFLHFFIFKKILNCFLHTIQLHVGRKAKYIKQYTINKSVIVCLEIN